MTDALAKTGTRGLRRPVTWWREAEATIRIAEAKDPDALENAGDSVYATCKACHGRYKSGSVQ